MAELLALQEQISAEQMQLRKGETFKCFVSGKNPSWRYYVAARTDRNLITSGEGGRQPDRLLPKCKSYRTAHLCVIRRTGKELNL